MCNLSRNNVGHEQSGVRPVLVVSADIRNENSNNVFVFPITHARKKFQPCHYILSNKDYPFFNFERQIVLCEEGRSISKERLERFLGAITQKDISYILECKEYVFVETEEVKTNGRE